MTHPFDLDAFVKNHDHPLNLVCSVNNCQPDDRGLTIHAQTKRYRRHFHDRYGTMAELAVEEGLSPEAAVRVEFCTPEIIRFRFVPYAAEKVPENKTPMVVEDFSEESFPLLVQEEDSAIILQTEVLKVRLNKDPWHFSIMEREGNSLLQTIPAAVFQKPPTGTSTVSGEPTLTDAWPWFFRGVFPLGYVEDPQAGMIQSFESFESHHDEHYYGFGEKYSDLDKRGQPIALWPDNATGNTSPLSYKNIPFFHSSRGYGIFVNSAYPIQYHMGDQHHARCSMHVQEGMLDYYFIYGPSYKEILPRYTRITGRPQIPPMWSFGLWMSRMSYRTQEEVENVAQELRRREIPCDVIHIDTDWYETPWVSDLRFSEDRFPNPVQMIAALRDQGFRLTLWQLPYIGLESVLYKEGAELGYFAQDDEGKPYHINGFFGPTAVIDYSNPAAVDWIQKEFERLFSMGVAAIKTDFGEGAPTAAKYHAVPGLAMRNLYPLLYNKAVFEVTKKSTGEGIVWGRSTYAGSQRFPVHWGGDPAALWVDLGQIWHGGLGLGMSGLPFWSVDIGGFAGQPSPELFIRWAQAGLFVSHPRLHGAGPREPWAFGNEAEQIFTKYARLRYRLMPYVWSTANHCIRTSLPFLRPMMLDWQDDPTTAVIDDQFMFGEWLLVAPILDETNKRNVYLPNGRWFDFWTDEVHQGPKWLSVDAPLDTMPLYVRGGAIIPLAPEMNYTGEKAWDLLTLEIYPNGDNSFLLQDGDNEIKLSCYESLEYYEIAIGSGTRQYILNIHGFERPAKVTYHYPESLDTHATEAAWKMDTKEVLSVPIENDHSGKVIHIWKSA